MPHAVGDRWQVDDTYGRSLAGWRYVYQAIDQFGQVIDVLVSLRRLGPSPGAWQGERYP